MKSGEQISPKRKGKAGISFQKWLKLQKKLTAKLRRRNWDFMDGKYKGHD